MTALEQLKLARGRFIAADRIVFEKGESMATAGMYRRIAYSQWIVAVRRFNTEKDHER
jgi:hypothetical protein